jgi:hypothetical protein
VCTQVPCVYLLSAASTVIRNTSKALCPLFSLLSSSTIFCTLYGPLSPLWPSVPSTALCPLLRPSVPSKKQRNKRNDPPVLRNVLHNSFRQNSKSHRDLFRISDNRDYRDNHNYHSSEILSDNREIAIIGLAKKVAIIAIITSNMKQ